MKIGLITIGAELLNGARTDTNAAWIGREVIGAGGAIDWHMTVNDEKSAIQSALDVVPNSIDVVLCTGGLGPTHDEITSSVLYDYFGEKAEFDEPYMRRKRLLRHSSIHCSEKMFTCEVRG